MVNPYRDLLNNVNNVCCNTPFSNACTPTPIPPTPVPNSLGEKTENVALNNILAVTPSKALLVQFKDRPAASASLVRPKASKIKKPVKAKENQGLINLVQNPASQALDRPRARKNRGSLPGYAALIEAIVQIFSNRSTNQTSQGENETTLFNWKLGDMILKAKKEAGWSKIPITDLRNDIDAMFLKGSRGCSRRYLAMIINVSIKVPNFNEHKDVYGKLPWRNVLLLCNDEITEDEKLEIAKLSLENNWSEMMQKQYMDEKKNGQITWLPLKLPENQQTYLKRKASEIEAASILSSLFSESRFD